MATILNVENMNVYYGAELGQPLYDLPQAERILDTYDYDFEDCLNYEPEEYSMTINEAMSAAYGDEYDGGGADALELADSDPDQNLVDGLVDLDNPMMDDDTSYLN